MAPGRLHAEVSGTGPRLVLVHGFTQNAGAWGDVAERLGRGHELVAVDLPGHGRSTDIETDLWGAAAMVAAVGGSASYLGYSLGARVLLHMALSHPEAVERLILIGATPGMPSPEARAERRNADGLLADGLDPPSVATAEGEGSIGESERLDRFLDTWLAGPLFATLPSEATHLEARRRNTCRGLASSLRRCGTGNQEPLWDRLAELTMPVLVMAGEADDRFAEIGRRMVEAIGDHATLSLVPGAGHACHLERPEPAVAVIEAFLSETSDQPGR